MLRVDTQTIAQQDNLRVLMAQAQSKAGRKRTPEERAGELGVRGEKGLHSVREILKDTTFLGA